MVKQSFRDILASAIISPSVALHNFLLELRVQNKVIHAFYEGKTDESFYGNYIRAIKADNFDYKSYICGNNDGVYYQFDRLNKRNIGNNIIIFFSDKDLEDIIPYPRAKDDKIFVTDYYSAESYLVTEDMFERIWAEIFKQRSGTQASKLVTAKFQQCINDFYKFMKLVMTWTLYHRRGYEGVVTKPNLDCLKLKKIYTINDDLDFEMIVSSEEDIIKVLDEQTKCITSWTTWKKKRISLFKELEAFQFKHYVRGHNEMEFFIYFMNSAKNLLRDALGKAIKLSVEWTEANSIDILGPRVNIPKSLDHFLSKNIHPQLKLEEFVGHPG